MVRGLSLCVRLLVSVSFLELYLLCDLILFNVAYLVYRSHMFSSMMFFYKFCFSLCLFVDLTFHVLFFSVLKSSKTHKN